MSVYKGLGTVGWRGEERVFGRNEGVRSRGTAEWRTPVGEVLVDGREGGCAEKRASILIMPRGERRDSCESSYEWRAEKRALLLLWQWGEEPGPQLGAPSEGGLCGQRGRSLLCGVGLCARRW